MQETRLSGSEGGGTLISSPYPLSRRGDLSSLQVRTQDGSLVGQRRPSNAPAAPTSEFGINEYSVGVSP